MQKINKKIILAFLTILLVFSASTFCFAVNSASSSVRNTASNNSIENETSEDSTNQVYNEAIEDIEDESVPVYLNYPDLKEEDTMFGPLTIEQIIGGAAGLMCFVGIILAISLYSRSREDEEEWNEDEYINNTQVIEREEPKAMQELKDEAASKKPKAIEELADEKKLEKIRKAREDKKEKAPNGDDEIEERKEDTASLNYRHQQALDDFYNYAEEIKQEKKTKRGKGKHSM